MRNFKLSDTIVTKSDQLNAEDLLLSNRIIKITDVKMVKDPQQPLVINYDGDNGRPFKPCLTMRKALQFAYGDDPKNLIGKFLELYCDPEVRFGKEKVGGVRIAGMSDIKGTIRASFTETRGKKKEYVFKRIEGVELPPYPAEKFEQAFGKMKEFIVSGQMTHEQVINHCEKTGRLSDEQKQKIRDVEVDDEPHFIDGE